MDMVVTLKNVIILSLNNTYSITYKPSQIYVKTSI
jgi:hypothetical protein